MTSIFFDPDLSDGKRLGRLYQGDIIVYAPTPSTLALREHARIEPMNPAFPQLPTTKTRIRDVLIELRCDPERTYFSPPRVRDARFRDPHRETWYAAPPSQIIWVLCLDDAPLDGGVTFFPKYWSRSIANGSRKFDYYERDAGFHPLSEEPLDLDNHLRLHPKAGSIILFSAAHLHANAPSALQPGTRCIDFRTVNIDDVTAHNGARNTDAHPTGTSLRSFVQARDGRRLPEELIEEYDTPSGRGRCVFTPSALPTSN